MIHTFFSLSGYSIREELANVSASQSAIEVFSILDEMALCLSIECVKRWVWYHPGRDRALFSVTLLEGGLVIGRAASLAMKLFGHRLLFLESTIDSIKELATVLLLNLSYPHYWIHEQGHAIVGRFCFKNAEPKVTILPFLGGKTSVNVSYGLTRIGKAFGTKMALCALSLGGLGATALWATGEIALANRMGKGGRILLLHAIAQLFQDTIYAITYYWESPHNRKHDLVRFCLESKAPAILPIIAMIALPTIGSFWTRSSA